MTSFTTYPYLTGEQVTHLLYSSGSARYVSTKLKTLTDEKFLHRLDRETINFPYVYCLGIRGLRYLKTLGFDIPPFHPSEHARYKPQFLNHTLAVNDFLFTASTLPSSTPSIAVVDIRHDLTLKRTSQPVIPDGWIDFKINDFIFVIPHDLELNHFLLSRCDIKTTDNQYLDALWVFGWPHR